MKVSRCSLLALTVLTSTVPISLAFGQTSGTPSSTLPRKEDETIQLSPFVISTESEEGYYSPQAVSATRTRTELINLPINVAVFNENFINDIGARDLADIVQFAAGVTQAPTAVSDIGGGDTLGFNIRGQSTFVPNRNGVRRLRVVDPVTIQRVEVIKGPNSLLYGPAAPGGGTNYVTKRPIQRKVMSSTVQVGSYDFYKASVDVNVPTESKNLAVRFVGSYEDSQSWADYAHKYQKTLYPSLTWWIRPETTFTIEYEQTVSDRHAPGGIFPQHNAIDTEDMANLVGLHWNNRGPHDYINVEMTAFTAELQHKFNEHFNLRLAWSDTDWEDITKSSQPASGLVGAFAVGSGTSPSTGGTPPPVLPWRYANGRPHTYGDRGSFDTYRQVELFNTFEVFGAKVQNLYGFQLGKEKFVQVLSTVATPTTDNTFWNLMDPSTWIPTERFAPASPVNYGQSTGTYARNNLKSGYLVTQIEMMGGKLHLMGGARVDKINTDGLVNPTVNNTVQYLPDGSGQPPPAAPVQNYVYTTIPSKLSPQGGILFKPMPGLSFYANYSRSIANVFTSVARRSDGSEFIPTPSAGEGYDFGVKTDLFKGKLSSVLSFYQLDEKDIVRQLATITVPGVNNGVPFVPTEQSGVNRSQGVDLDISARPMKGLQIGGAYGYNYSWVVSDDASFVFLNGGPTNGTKVETRTGHQLANSNRHRVSGWVRKDFGPLAFFKNTFGMVTGSYTGKRPWTEAFYKAVSSPTDGGYLAESPKLDSYMIFSFTVGGDFEVDKRRVNMSINVKNAFDERYVANRFFWGAPREILFTTRVNF